MIAHIPCSRMPNRDVAAARVVAGEIAAALDVVQRRAVQIGAAADEKRHRLRKRLQTSLPALRVASFASFGKSGIFDKRSAGTFRSIASSSIFALSGFFVRHSL